MNKQMLLEAVLALPDDVEILASKDDEGNGYRWISGLSLEYIHESENSGWETECVMSEEDLKDEDYTEEDIAGLVKVAVIW